MTYGAQKDVLRMIPGLENAEFARLGGIHRNTFINSPKVLNDKLQLKSQPRIRFAGQVSGVEGYVESAAMGLLAGRFAAFGKIGPESSRSTRNNRTWFFNLPCHRRASRR